jgi:hypothetical protein
MPTPDGAQETSMGAAKVDQKRDVRAKSIKFSSFSSLPYEHTGLSVLLSQCFRA